MPLIGKVTSQGIAEWLENARWRLSYSPYDFYPVIGVLLPWFSWGAAACCAAGFYLGLVAAPPGARHGELFPILFIHVPAAWMSLCIYLLMAFCAGTGLLFRASLVTMMAQAMAPTGAMFALVTLWSGSLWGKPTWGTWWDPQLAAELVLLLLYGAVIAFRITIEDARRADRTVAIVSLLGVVAVPGFLAATASWRTFHQPSMMPTGTDAAWSHSAGLLVLLAAFWMYATAMALKRLRCVILERERQSDWVERQSDWLERRRGGTA
jgi:heme exporter protein C